MKVYKVMTQYNDGNKLVTLGIAYSILDLEDAFKIAHGLNSTSTGAIYYVEEE